MKTTMRYLFLTLAMLLAICLLTACSGNGEITESAVTSVTVNANGSKISVKAVLTEGELETYRNADQYNQKLYLMAMEPGETTKDLPGKQPVAETSLSASASFSLDTYAKDNLEAHSRLHCAYAVAVYSKLTKDYQVVTTSPVYVSNVSKIAENTQAFPKAASIKGLHVSVSSDAAHLGVAHAVLELDPSELILAGYSDKAVSYVYDGQTYYLDRGALETLDKQVKEYSAQGCIVYLRLRMCTSPKDANSLVSCLYANNGVDLANGKRAYAIWMDDEQSAALMTGFLDFITARYTDPEGTHGFCGALIIGRSVNESLNNHFAGGATSEEFLNDYVKRYHALVRLAHSTLKSHYAQGRVYVSVSDNLRDLQDKDITSGQGVNWTTERFLTAFNTVAVDSGNFDWNVAISAYGYSNAEPLWSEKNANSQILSPAHLEDFTWIMLPEHYYNGARRQTIVSDFEIAPGNDAITQAASYAYAYYKTLESEYVDALIYSAHTDKQGLFSGSGLRDPNVKVDMEDKDHRAIYNVFRTIDTKDTSYLDAMSLRSLIPGWSELYDKQSAKAATRQFVTGAEDFETPTTKSEVMFNFTDGTTDNFLPDNSISYLELRKDAQLGYPVLCAKLNRPSPNTYMGISNTTLRGSDVKGAKFISISLNAAVDSETPVHVKLRLVKQGATNLAAGDPQVVYEDVVQVSVNKWQTVYFDVSEFAALVDGNDPITFSIQIKVPDLAKDGKCELMVDRVQVYGNMGIQAYEWVIIVVSIIAVIGLIVGLVYLLYRKYGAPNIIANIFWNASKGKIRLRRFQKEPKATR